MPLWKWREPPARALNAKNRLGRRYPCRKFSGLLCTPLGCSRCRSPAKLAGTCFLRLGLFPSRPDVLAPQILHPEFWEPCRQHLLDRGEVPSKGHLIFHSATSPVCPAAGRAALHRAVLLLAGTGMKNFREPRRSHRSHL